MTTSIETETGVARSDGPSVQEIFGREANQQAVPDVLLSESYRSLGVEDLPRERYFSKAQHDLEVERMWRRTWLMACREDDIPAVGDCHVFDIAEDSIVVVRAAADRIKAYFNTCLHRGMQLCDEAKNVPSLRCPFHGWTWNLDGSLDRIPGQWDFPQVTAEEFCLPEVRVATWDGWVFINMDPAAKPFEEYVENLPELMSPWPLKDRYKAAHVAMRVACNWKVALEAFVESYHVQSTHPQLVSFFADLNSQYDIWGPNVSRVITMGGLPSPVLGPFEDEQAIADAFAAETQMCDPSAIPTLADGVTARDVLSDLIRRQMTDLFHVDLGGVPNADVLDAIEYLLFPNFLPWAGYGVPMVYYFRPDGGNPESCIIEFIMLVPFPEGQPKPPPAKIHWVESDWREAPELGEFLADVFNQDMANLPRIQRGLKTGRKTGVTLSEYQEVRIRHHAQTLDGYLRRP